VTGEGCEKSESVVDKQDLGKLVCALCSNGSINNGDTICFEYKCALNTSFKYNNQTYSATVVSSRPLELKKTESNPNAVMSPAFIEMFTESDRTIRLPVRNHYYLKAQARPLKVIELKDGSNNDVPKENWNEILRALKQSDQPVQLQPARPSE